MNDDPMNLILQNQARMEEQIKTLFHQQAELKTLTETVQRLAVTLERQGASLAATAGKVDSVKADVDEMKARPSRRWETALAAALSALVAFLLTRLGLK